ncbi:MAG: hypothetical protein HY272_01900 [Gammaproteobacteria bacterium]|nr:hypothetical protein [Gammaproteobacteria bacterium]
MKKMNGFALLIFEALFFCAANASGDNSTPADRKAMDEFRQSVFVKDLYVSPDHMNIGVLRREKQWGSSMFARWACGILARNGSQLAAVRFVDIEEVVHQNKSPTQAEISEFYCTPSRLP